MGLGTVSTVCRVVRSYLYTVRSPCKVSPTRQVRPSDEQLATCGTRVSYSYSVTTVSPFHIAPEINYHINPNWHIGLLGRIQFVNSISQNRGLASRVSVAGVIRAKRYFNWEKLKLFLGFGAGGGQIRHRIPVDDMYDTRVAQFIAFNIGGGVNYMFTDMVGATFETGMLIMVPDFAAHLDFNAGLILCF